MHPDAEGLRFGARFATPILIGPALNPINTTMISVALLPIATACNVSAATCIWLVASLYLVSAIFQPTMGKVCDQYGPRRVYLSGLLVCMIAGVIPSLSATFTAALIARILIGFGTSCCYPATMSFIRDQSLRIDKPAPQALLSGVAISSMVTSCIGPVLGGFLLKYFPWQSIFLVNIPIAAVAFVLALLWLPYDSTRISRHHSKNLAEAIDPVGILCFSVTIVALLFFLLDLRKLYIWLALIAIAAAVSLVLWERRNANPFIDVRMLSTNLPLVRTYLRLILLTTACYMIIYGLIQWSEACMDVSTSTAGLIQIPQAVIAFACSFLVLRSKRLRAPLAAAAAATLAAGILIIGLHSGSPLVVLIVIVTLFGIPQGLNNLSNQAALYVQAPEEYLGTAAGLSRTAMHLAAILSSGMIGIIFYSGYDDTGVMILGIIVLVCSSIALLLTLADRSLKTSER